MGCDQGASAGAAGAWAGRAARCARTAAAPSAAAGRCGRHRHGAPAGPAPADGNRPGLTPECDPFAVAARDRAVAAAASGAGTGSGETGCVDTLRGGASRAGALPQAALIASQATNGRHAPERTASPPENFRLRNPPPWPTDCVPGMRLVGRPDVRQDPVTDPQRPTPIAIAPARGIASLREPRLAAEGAGRPSCS